MTQKHDSSSDDRQPAQSGATSFWNVGVSVGARPYDDCNGDCGERGMYCCDGGWNTRAGAEVERLRKALDRAHTQLSKHDYKGPKQITRALTTMEQALGIEVAPVAPLSQRSEESA